jgi:2-oxoisovalerate dehydrogenase E1 component beta subunit
MFGGKAVTPMVIRAMYGAGIRAASQHSQALYPIFTHIPGLKVVAPSNPYDAKGLLLASLADPDPIIFFEPKRLYRAAKGDVPEGAYTVPLESARVVRPGTSVTVLAYGAMLYEALDAAAKAAEKGVEAEVIDLRTLWPVDMNSILDSVKRTGRLVVVHEAPRTLGFGAELLSLVVERAFYHLEAAPVRVTGFDTPFPYALEMEYMPLSHRILPALLDVTRA